MGTKIRIFTLIFSILLLNLPNLSAGATSRNGKASHTQKVALNFDVPSSLKSDLDSLKLSRHQKLGLQVTRALERAFQTDFTLQGEGQIENRPLFGSSLAPQLAFEKWLMDYQQILKSSSFIQSQPLGNMSIQEMVRDVNQLMKVKNLHEEDIRGDKNQRKLYLQTALGITALLEALESIHIGSNKDQLTSLRSYVLTQAGIQLAIEKEFSFEDIWWNALALRQMKYPIDLVYNTQLVYGQMIERAKADRTYTDKDARVQRWKLARASLGYMAVYLKTGSLLNKESEARFFVQVIQEAMRDFQDLRIPSAEENLRIQKYRWLMKSGETLEAGFVRSQIAWDQVKNKFVRISSAHSVRDFLFYSFAFFIYVVGYIFVATPIELFVILAAILILYRQGKEYFRLENDFVWNWKKPFEFTQHCTRSLNIAWRMFVTSYTGTAVPFYSKVASSLLLFGLGLLFNGARLILESMVNQMAF